MPNLAFGPPEGFTWATDRHGFTINDPSQAGRDLRTKDDSYRIFLVGGSTVMGTGTITNLAAAIERALSEAGDTKYQVINAGWSGYSSPMELTTVTHKILYFQPDMVISFDGYNDAAISILLRDYSHNDHQRGQELSYFLASDSGWIDKYALLDFIGKFYSARLFFRMFEMTLDYHWPKQQIEKDRFIFDVLQN